MRPDYGFGLVNNNSGMHLSDNGKRGGPRRPLLPVFLLGPPDPRHGRVRQRQPSVQEVGRHPQEAACGTLKPMADRTEKQPCLGKEVEQEQKRVLTAPDVAAFPQGAPPGKTIRALQ